MKAFIAASGLLCVAMAAIAQEQPAPKSPAERFVEFLQTRTGADAAARDAVLRKWAATPRPDEAEFLTEALASLHAEFRAALDARDRDDPRECAEVTRRLSEAEDPYLAAAATVLHVKALLDAGDAAAALKAVETSAGDRRERIGQYSYGLAEFDFCHAAALLENLQYDAASRKLVQFLTVHPDAPVRLTQSARQMLAELEARTPGQIGEVSDLMSFAAGRLKHGDTGEQVQARQQRAIDLLDQMIEEAEDRERNQQNQPDDGSQGGSPRQNPSQPQSPMPQSQLPPDGAVREHLSVRDINPGEAWGALPPAEREKVLQALRDSFPPRYRKLVEQYYEQLAREPK
ncbi:MAG: hypothetical protein FLDDKLPJ_01892 [Phycisphaerae bacterium]|nr:hypothetical protein [Phycisphaerae bacterium]